VSLQNPRAKRGTLVVLSFGWVLTLVCVGMVGCRGAREDSRTVVMVIESSPNNLDLRVGTDAQSERVGGLIFDALVKKDEHFKLQPWLATSWEQPDALTWVFHLRDGVRFQDGRPLGAEDVAWTIRSMMDGSLITAKGGAFANVAGVEVRDRLTVVVRMKRADEALLFNMSDGLFGVVPKGAGQDFGLHPVGSGAFRFVSAVQDKEAVLERNPEYWAAGIDWGRKNGGVSSIDPTHRDKTAMNGAPEPLGLAGQRIERVRFAVVPDAITTALELKKGSADVESNVITLDMVHALRDAPGLVTESGPGSAVVYMNFNVTDPVLKDKRVRQAVACAIDRQAIVDAIWRGQARLAGTLLPVGHWAAASDAEMASYPHDVARAKALLEAAGFRAGKDGVRLRMTMKTSTDETTRLMAAVLQQQLRAAGIEMEIRSAEFGTFYADVTRGAFQMYVLRWIGSNEDPDIFRYAYATESFPPKGGNRGRYSNARVDALITAAAAETDQEKRRAEYVEVQRILAEELPGIPLWYPNNEVVHTRRLVNVRPRVSGSFDFLRDAEVGGR
jgi:peptide/nickel transport system substrate-binding protein